MKSRLFKGRVPAWWHYGVAIAAVTSALLLTLLLQSLLEPTIFVLFFPAVLISAMRGGKGPGLLAIALSLILTRYFLITPPYKLAIADINDFVRLTIFAAVLLLIYFVSIDLRTSKKQAEERLRQLQANENRFQVALKSASITLIQQDANLRYQWIDNPQNYPVDLVLGKTDYDLFSLADAERLTAIKQQVLDSGIPSQEEVMLTIEGQPRYYDLRVEPIRSAHGYNMGVFCAAVDMTDYRRTKNALQESDSRFRRLIESNLFGVSIGLLNGGIIEANSVLLDMMGYTDGEWTEHSLSWEQITPPEYLPLDAKASDELRRRGVFTPFEKEYIRRDGSRIPVLIGGALLQESPHQPQKVICFHLDLRELRHTAAELRRAKERFELATSVVKGLVYEWNTRTNLIDRTRGMVDVVGYSPEEVDPTADWWFQRVHPDDRERLHSAIETAHQQNLDSLGVDYRVRHRDGEYRYVWDQARLYRNKAGEFVRAVGFTLDISDRKRAEETQAYLIEASEVLASSLDYQTTLTSLTHLTVPRLADWCSIHICEEDGSVQELATAHVNPDKLAWVKEFRRKYPINLNDSQGVALVLRTGQSVLYSHVTNEMLVEAGYDAEYLRLLRELGLCSVMIVPLRIHANILGAISFIFAESGRRYTQTDLSLAEELARRAALAVENARLYRSAQRDRAKAEAANRSKDEFLATLSHELRTPLNAMLGWMQLLTARQMDEAATQRALDTIYRNTRSLYTIIKDLLDISSITSGKLRLQLQPTDLVPVITAAMEAVYPAAIAKSITLQFHPEPSLPPETAEFKIQDSKLKTNQLSTPLVLADPDRLQQVIWNLLSNAVKFTPPDGQVHITVSQFVPPTNSTQNSKFKIQNSNSSTDAVHPISPRSPAPSTQHLIAYAQIQVTDTGIGIDPNFLPYVFDRFSQADMTTTKTYGGLGLGLAIVRNLVEMQGGVVQVHSDGLNQGTTFTIRLPLLPPD